jgi:hypothetical protein
MSARIEKIYKNVNKLSELFTAKDEKNAKQERFLQHIFAPACRFKSAFICVYLRFRIAKALILLKSPARNKIYKNVHKYSTLFTAKNAKQERYFFNYLRRHVDLNLRSFAFICGFGLPEHFYC